LDENELQSSRPPHFNNDLGHTTGERMDVCHRYEAPPPAAKDGLENFGLIH